MPLFRITSLAFVVGVLPACGAGNKVGGNLQESSGRDPSASDDGLTTDAATTMGGGTHSSSGLPSNEEDGGGNSGSDDGIPTLDGPHLRLTVAETHGAVQSQVIFAIASPAPIDPYRCMVPVEGCYTPPDPCQCDQGQVCVVNESCDAHCEAPCDLDCAGGEVCQRIDGEAVCTPVEFHAGTLTVDGGTAPLSLVPPYLARTGADAAFAPLAQVAVQAEGSGRTPGFDAFELTGQTPATLELLDGIDDAEFHGDAPLAVSWSPGSDHVVVQIAGQHGIAYCPADDTAGTFTIPRSVFDTLAGRFSSIMVTRSRSILDDEARVHGQLDGQVFDVGRIEIRGESTAASTASECPGEGLSTAYCSHTQSCELILLDPSNCGACGHDCGTYGSCSNGNCVGTGPCIDDCRIPALTGACEAEADACLADPGCAQILDCVLNFIECSSAACEFNTCSAGSHDGHEIYANLMSCQNSACALPCQGDYPPS